MKNKFKPTPFWIQIEEAEKLRFCKKCNFAGRFKKQTKPCNYHSHGEWANFRHVPAGRCALRPVDRDRMKSDFGCDREGRLILK